MPGTTPPSSVGRATDCQACRSSNSRTLACSSGLSRSGVSPAVKPLSRTVPEPSWILKPASRSALDVRERVSGMPFHRSVSAAGSSPTSATSSRDCAWSTARRASSSATFFRDTKRSFWMTSAIVTHVMRIASDVATRVIASGAEPE